METPKIDFAAIMHSPNPPTITRRDTADLYEMAEKLHNETHALAMALRDSAERKAFGELPDLPAEELLAMIGKLNSAIPFLADARRIAAHISRVES